jgi:hypothetical protein
MTTALAAQRDYHVDQANHYRRQAALTTDTHFAWRLKRDADREMDKANRLDHLANVLALAGAADRIEWRNRTVRRDGSHGIDGNLYFHQDGQRIGSIPLDTYSTASPLAPAGHDLSADGAGMAVTVGGSKADHHDAVRAWCELMLGRSDVEVCD